MHSNTETNDPSYANTSIEVTEVIEDKEFDELQEEHLDDEPKVRLNKQREIMEEKGKK